MAAPKVIYHTGSVDAEYTVERLKAKRSMRNVAFERMRYGDLTELKGKAVMIWGNGDEHQASYYFDWPGSEPLTKINIDQHSDIYEQIGGEALYCGNHFLYSTYRPKRKGALLLPSRLIKGEMSLPCYVESIPFLNPNNIIKGKFTEVEIQMLKDPLHITIDLDIVDMFPVLDEYVGINCWSDNYLMQVVKGLSSNEWFRFDVGGITWEYEIYPERKDQVRHITKPAYSKKRYEEALRIMKRLLLIALEKTSG
ncbi:hypothetical protein KO465_02730 [Candidatus Micrarchaeota archaeon]|nr:hypothetical protein [Candidatus Micrarchaeota archaeon]